MLIVSMPIYHRLFEFLCFSFIGISFIDSSCAWLGRHRIEAPRLALCLWPFTSLGQEQESGRASRQTRARGRLGPREMAVKKKTTEKTRTHFAYRIDTWTKPDAQDIVEHVAGVE